MRTYLLVSGGLFGILFIIHLGRVVAEGPSALADPFFTVSSIAAAAMSIWAMALNRRGK